MEVEHGTPDGGDGRRKWLLPALFVVVLLLALAGLAFWWTLEYTPIFKGYVADESYLQDAALSGDVQTVQAILDDRPELVNMIWAGSPPLIEAAQAGQLDVVQLLIANGADVNVVTPFGGQTPIMAACLGGQTQVTEVLIQAGAEVNAIDWQHNTGLDYARAYGDAELVELLLKHGAKGGSELGTTERTPAGR